MEEINLEIEPQEVNNGHVVIDLEAIQPSTSSSGGENCGEERSNLATEVEEGISSEEDRGQTQEENNGYVVIDMEAIQPFASSFRGEHCGEEPSNLATDVEQGIDRGQTRGCFLKRFICQAVLIGILMVILSGMAGVLYLQIIKHQSVSQLQMQYYELQNFLNYYQNISQLGTQPYPSWYINSLSNENVKLKKLLSNALQENGQLQVQIDGLNTDLKLTLAVHENSKEEVRHLNMALEKSSQIISLAAAESEQWRLLLTNEQEVSKQLVAKNELQRSILFSNKLSFLWNYCSKDTLQCSRCMPGWVEHDSRCFFMPHETKTWEDARRDCLDKGADLAVVLNKDDQEFLTTMTYNFDAQYPEEELAAAWIGLRDMAKKGDYIWVNGNKLRRDLMYWYGVPPNEFQTYLNLGDTQERNACTGIIPPSYLGRRKWLSSWDEENCNEKQHYLCETPALSLA